MFQDDGQGSFNPSPDIQRYEEYLDLPLVVKEYQWQRFAEQDSSGLVRIKKHGDMHVDAMMVADLDDVLHKGEPRSVQQLVNTASLPGIVGEAWAMADWHHGYGFPIGGVVATKVEWGDLGGSISPGGVGFDINCGVRALALDITKDDINDLAVLTRVGLPIAVANARADVKTVAKYTTNAAGGDGAVREVCDAILRAKGQWGTVIERLKDPEGYREQ